MTRDVSCNQMKRISLIWMLESLKSSYIPPGNTVPHDGQTEGLWKGRRGSEPGAEPINAQQGLDAKSITRTMGRGGRKTCVQATCLQLIQTIHSSHSSVWPKSPQQNPDLVSPSPFPLITLVDNQVARCPRGKAMATHSQSIQSPPAVTGVSERGGTSCWLAEGGVAGTCGVEWRGVAMRRLGMATWRGFMASTLLVWMWKAGATQAPQGQRSPADRNGCSDSADDSSLNRVNLTGEEN